MTAPHLDDAGLKPARMSRRAVSALDLVDVLLRTGPVVILAVAIVVLRILSPVFLSTQNIKNVGTQSSIVAVIAVGELLVILVRGIDISVGSVVGFSAVAGAAIAATHTNATTLILATAGSGLAVGLCNGTIVVKGRIPQPLIVTVASLGIVRGLALLIANGTVEVGVPSTVATLGGGYIGPIPVPVIVASGVALTLWLLTRRTVWGRWVYAVGGNPESAKRLGIPTGAVTVSAYALCGLTAAIASVLVAGRTGTIDPNAGVGNELDAITAVVIGGASLSGGRGSVLNVAIGALILGVIRNGLDLLNVSSYYQTIAVGGLVLVALEIDVLRRQVGERLKVRQAAEANDE